MTSKSAARTSPARKKLLAQIADAKKQAAAARDKAREAKQLVRDAKRRLKATKRYAKRLKKKVKALRADASALSAKLTRTKVRRRKSPPAAAPSVETPPAAIEPQLADTANLPIEPPPASVG